MSPILAGGLVGAGAFGAQLQRQRGAEDLQKLQDEAANMRQQALIAAQAARQGEAQAHDVKMVGVRETSRQTGAQSDIDRDTSPENVSKRGTAAVGLMQATLPAKVEERKALGDADTDIEFKRFTSLAPAKRQEAIDTEVAKIKALSTPEILAANKKIALSKHISEPSFVAKENEDGSVLMVDSKNPKNTVLLTNPDGSPAKVRNPAQLTAATAVLNDANRELSIAQAEHKAALADLTISPADKAKANAAWASAQEKALQSKSGALAVILGRAGAAPAASTAPSGSGVDWSKFISSPAPKGPGPRVGAPATTSPTDTTSASTDAPSRLAQLNAEYEKQSAEIGKGKRRNYDASLMRELAELTDRGPGEKAYLDRERRGIMNNPMMR